MFSPSNGILSINLSQSSPPASAEPPVAKWTVSDISKWLKDLKMSEYLETLQRHAITTGPVLLQITEHHLEEMGISSIGHRLALINAIDALRHANGLTLNAKYIDINVLLNDLEQVYNDRDFSLHPKRIILIRHAQSQGNVDSSLYSRVPDAQLELTDRGRLQAQEAGVKLKELIGDESCGVYMSPYARSRQTSHEIIKGLSKEQLLFLKEDPRIREQEWGNFQVPEKMPQVMEERRKIGAFFYRFPTGESGADVYDRVSMFLDSLYRDMRKGHCGENVVIVSHGLFCRLFLTRFYHWKVEYFHRLWNFTNCQFAVMKLQKEGYQLITPLKMDEY